MTDLENYQKLRIEALDKFISLQQFLIDEKDKIIDETIFKYSESKAKYNMLIRNIEVTDEIFEKPIKK